MLVLKQQSPKFTILSILLFILGLGHTVQGTNSASHTQCKSATGSPSWPSARSWATFNEQVDGRLLQPTPPGAVCHPGPSYNAARCSAVQTAWTTYSFHSEDPVSSDWNQWNNDTCLPDPRAPCSGAGYPVYVVNATRPTHVQAAVKFAGKYNIRLIVKSSGHDYQGRSSAPNSLSIWVHHMKGIKIHDNGFKPQRCNVKIQGGAVTLGGGTQMDEIYRALDAVNRTMVGGMAKTVSVGGYITGGGHSLLSSRYGLAADQVLEMEIVTPTGEFLTLNECMNTDLFWAMRGGGGSTFGIMTSVTVKTYPSPPIVSLTLIIATLDPGPLSSSVFDVITYFLSQLPALGDAGLSGYVPVLSKYPNPLDGGNTTVGGLVGLLALQDTQSPNDMLALVGPIVAHINTTWPGYTIIPNITAYPSFWTWYQDHYDQGSAGSDIFIGSRLLDEHALTADLNASRAAYAQLLSGSGTGTAHLVGGKGVRDAQPRGGGDAVLPAWRKSYVHLTGSQTFPPLNATARTEALAKVDYYIDGLRKLAPNSGSYVNEASPDEPDWQHQFWGDHYERLVKIKRKVDPNDVLWCTPCVGNERWHQVDGRLCRVPGQ